MEFSTLLRIAADVLLLVHVLFVAFMVLGLVCIVLGKLRCWLWVRNRWFRLCHVVAMAVVMIQTWLGIICPLTKFEMALRSRAGDAVYSESFIGYWLSILLYYHVPAWVFVVGYTLFGLAVAVSWLWVRPR